MGELGSDNAELYWVLLLMIMCLPLAIWLSLVLAGLPVSDGGLSVLQVCGASLSSDG